MANALLRRKAATFIIPAVALMLLACGGEPPAPDPDPSPLPDPSVVIATGPIPSHLTIRNGTMFWSAYGEEVLQRAAIGAATPTPVAWKMEVPANVVVHGSDLYWLEERSGASPAGCLGAGVIRIIWRTAATGVTTALAVGDNCWGFGGFATEDLAVDDAHVYWVSATASPPSYVLWQTPLAGGPSSKVTETGMPIIALKANASDVFWLENNFPGDTSTIRSIPRGGGPVTVRVDGIRTRAWTFAVSDASAFYLGANFPETDDLVEVPLAGGPRTVLATLDYPPIDLAADASALYWIDSTAVRALPFGGAPQTLATITRRPLALYLQGPRLWWTETTGDAHGETGAVKSVLTTGGGEDVFVDGGDAPRRLAFTPTWVYWTEGGGIGLVEGFGRIARAPVGGGPATTVRSGISDDAPRFVLNGTDALIADKFRIERVPLSGGISETVVKGDFYIADLVTDGSFVYWALDPQGLVFKAPVDGGTTSLVAGSAPHTGPVNIVRLQNGTLYWLIGNDAILSVPAAGGDVTVVASGLPFVSDFVVDGDDIFFSEHDTGDIKRLTIATGAITTLAEDRGGAHRILAYDATDLFWLAQTILMKVPKAGGEATALAMSLELDALIRPSLAIDGGYAYWTDVVNQAIWRVPK